MQAAADFLAAQRDRGEQSEGHGTRGATLRDLDNAVAIVATLRDELTEATAARQAAAQQAQAHAQALAEHQAATADDSGEGTGNVFDADALVDAMRRTSVRDPAIDKGSTPTWNVSKGERFSTFEHRVELWLNGHGLKHLLTQIPAGAESALHDKAMAVVCMALPPQDLEYIKGQTELRNVWAALKAKYMPSKDAEVRLLFDKLNRATLRGSRPKQVSEYCSYILSLVNQLTALGAPPLSYQVSHKLFEPLGKDYTALRVG